jgi:hypothetical protein
MRQGEQNQHSNSKNAGKYTYPHSTMDYDALGGDIPVAAMSRGAANVAVANASKRAQFVHLA